MRLRVVRLFLLCGVLALAVTAGLASTPALAGAATKLRVGGQNVTVSPVLEASRSSSATLGAGGGTLSTTAEDGTVLRLTLPRGALAGNELVTLTPLKSLARAGLKLVAGAQLAPDGLRLLKPGTLSITTTRVIRTARQVAFGYQGAGQQFGLLPFALRPGIEVPVMTFGGVGVGRATAGQLAGRSSHLPSDPQSAWLAQLAIPLYAERQNRSVAADRQLVSGLLAAFYSSYVKPLLHHSGANINTWTAAAARSIAWRREVRALGYGRQFAGDNRHIRSTVFGTALRKRWRLVSGACSQGRQTLGHLRTALILGHTAQSAGAGARIGGPGGIAAVVHGCAQLGVQAALDQVKSQWNAALSSTYLAQIVAYVQTAATPLSLQSVSGPNSFTFTSGPTAPTERLVSWGLSPGYLGQGCSTPSFLGFSSDPGQMSATFTATLTVPADLFEGASPPPPTATLASSGTDLANWSMSCPHGTTNFSQAPGAMAGLGAVTGITPINISLAGPSTTAKFSGSADILSGGTVTAVAMDNGTVTVVVPQ